MIKFSRIAVVVAVATTALSSAAFAQSYDPQAGTTGGHHGRMAHRAHVRTRAATPQSGLNAFGFATTSNPFSPALTGGGSAGYNENLRKDAW
jgi:opacity protein-like surface antigen